MGAYPGRYGNILSMPLHALYLRKQMLYGTGVHILEIINISRVCILTALETKIHLRTVVYLLHHHVMRIMQLEYTVGENESQVLSSIFM